MKINPVVAISSGDHKLAALLFDYVLPMIDSNSVPQAVIFKQKPLIQLPSFSIEDYKEEYTKIYIHSLGNLPHYPGVTVKVNDHLGTTIKIDENTDVNISNKTTKELKDLLKREQKKLKDLRKKLPDGFWDAYESFRKTLTNEYNLNKTQTYSVDIPNNYHHDIMYECLNSFVTKTHKELTTHKIRSVPLFKSTILSDMYLRQGNTDAIEATLYNAPLINTSNLTWEQVLEIREDKKFTSRLRNFRLFINENYMGKDKNYIFDSLSKKLEEYEKSCKNHGVEIVLSSISQTLDSKSLLGAMTITAACILTGNPVIANLGLISGALIELGQLTIGVLQKNLEYEKQKDNGELCYLVKIKKLDNDH